MIFWEIYLFNRGQVTKPLETMHWGTKRLYGDTKPMDKEHTCTKINKLKANIQYIASNRVRHETS